MPVVVGDVLEARILGQEHQLYRPGRSVPLFADDDLGDVGLVGGQVFLVLVEALAIQEEDHVCVLLERTAVVTDDPVRKPGSWTGDRQVEDFLLASRLDADDPVPKQIARRVGAQHFIIEDLRVLP